MAAPRTAVETANKLIASRGRRAMQQLLSHSIKAIIVKIDASGWN